MSRTYLVSYADRHEQQWKRVTSVASFFCEEPRTGARAEDVSRDQSLAFKERSIYCNSQASTVGRRKKKKHTSFFERAASRFSKAYLYKLQRKYSKNWLRTPNIKSYLTPKRDPKETISIYAATAQAAHGFRANAKMPTTFWRWSLSVSTHVFYAFLPSPWRTKFCFLFSFSLEVLDLRRPNTS